MPMGQYVSIFEATMHAIEKCVQINLDKIYDKVVILSAGSRAAIKALSLNVFDFNLAWL